jgi:hypothetical protein
MGEPMNYCESLYMKRCAWCNRIIYADQVLMGAQIARRSPANGVQIARRSPANGAQIVREWLM